MYDLLVSVRSSVVEDTMDDKDIDSCFFEDEICVEDEDELAVSSVIGDAKTEDLPSPPLLRTRSTV